MSVALVSDELVEWGAWLASADCAVLVGVDRMDDREEVSTRWRRLVLALSILLILALAGEALLPAISAAKPQRKPGHARLHSESKVDRQKPDRSSGRKGVHAQIVGGTVVPQGKFNFLAFIEVDTGDEAFLCGGTLIDPSFVLTAAHCVTDEFGDKIEADAFEVSIGKANLNAVEPENIRFVDSVSRHPDFDELTLENDVAVLELDDPIFGDIAQVVPFVGSGDTRFDGAGQDAVTAGWGTTSEGGDTSDLLLEADVDIVSDSSCVEDYEGSGSEVNPTVMICAAFPGRDSCQGDSGGPLMAKEVVGFTVKKGKKKKHKKRKKKRIPIIEVTQTGIVSFGIGCAQPDFPGVYTRISAPGINDFIIGVVDS